MVEKPVFYRFLYREPFYTTKQEITRETMKINEINGLGLLSA
jgi:hypothetical protein